MDTFDTRFTYINLKYGYVYSQKVWPGGYQENHIIWIKFVTSYNGSLDIIKLEGYRQRYRQIKVDGS